MKNIKQFIILLFLGILFCSTYYFIIISNDHIECETIVSTKIDNAGNKIVETKHVCKEKFSF